MAPTTSKGMPIAKRMGVAMAREPIHTEPHSALNPIIEGGNAILNAPAVIAVAVPPAVSMLPAAIAPFGPAKVGFVFCLLHAGARAKSKVSRNNSCFFILYVLSTLWSLPVDKFNNKGFFVKLAC